jgi:hypothetical protein
LKAPAWRSDCTKTGLDVQEFMKGNFRKKCCQKDYSAFWHFSHAHLIHAVKKWVKIGQIEETRSTIIAKKADV